MPCKLRQLTLLNLGGLDFLRRLFLTPKASPQPRFIQKYFASFLASDGRRPKLGSLLLVLAYCLSFPTNGANLEGNKDRFQEKWKMFLRSIIFPPQIFV